MELQLEWGEAAGASRDEVSVGGGEWGCSGVGVTLAGRQPPARERSGGTGVGRAKSKASNDKMQKQQRIDQDVEEDDGA
jgi:hypothetical protein